MKNLIAGLLRISLTEANILNTKDVTLTPEDKKLARAKAIKLYNEYRDLYAKYKMIKKAYEKAKKDGNENKANILFNDLTNFERQNRFYEQPFPDYGDNPDFKWFFGNQL